MASLNRYYFTLIYLYINMVYFIFLSIMINVNEDLSVKLDYNFCHNEWKGCARSKRSLYWTL